MKRFIIATLIAFALISTGRAQTAGPSKPTPNIPGVFVKAPVLEVPIAQPTAEQKAKLSELAKAWDQKVREADTARDKYLIALMATLAELGLKPSETSVSWNAKGEPVFGRAEAAKVTPKEKQ